MENLSIPPAESSFISIDDFQSRTPESFHGPTILYYKASQCKLVATEHDISSTRELNALRLADTGVNGSSAENADEENEKEVVVEGLDLWVTSDKFFLYSTATSTGLSIPYRSISLHAIQRLKLPAQTAEVQGLYMHITNAATASSFPQESDEEESLTVTIVPPTATPSEGEESEIQKLYDAVSACANLHPDPVEEEEHDAGVFASGLVFPGSGEDGGLPPPVDGSSGWITAENMHEFFDEEGNWIGEGDGPSFPGMGSGLGPGAGTVRGRSEEAEEQGADGRAGADGDETKWRRID
ncbi:regulator of volume decrease after cellular swelling-domain-containing protein [Aspergillus multicolor]|uniref:Voldacs domain-containing protein n=1 Tax=Aspergillus multicolor TaxID=41759 RepID=UPI003CCD2E17